MYGSCQRKCCLIPEMGHQQQFNFHLQIFLFSTWRYFNTKLAEQDCISSAAALKKVKKNIIEIIFTYCLPPRLQMRVKTQLKTQVHPCLVTFFFDYHPPTLQLYVHPKQLICCLLLIEFSVNYVVLLVTSRLSISVVCRSQLLVDLN